MRLTFFVLFIFGFSMQGLAGEVVRRHVETEWEPIEGAKTYDLELKLGKKKLNFKAKESKWQGELAPGPYEMRMRARDLRGVPGDWSAAEPFAVYLEDPKVLTPKPDEQIKSTEEDTTRVSWKWKPVPGAHHYLFEVKSEDGTFKSEEKVSDPKIQVKLPVAHGYQWALKAVGETIENEKAVVGQFEVVGQALAPVKLAKPENDFVRELHWEMPKYATESQYSIQKFETKTKQWKTVQAQDKMKSAVAAIDPAWEGGKYRLIVNTHANLRADAPAQHVDFQVRSGDRSPAAEEVATLRQSIESRTPWTGMASYLLTVTDYQGINYDRANSKLHYNAIGGTGRLGLEYAKPKSAFGFQGIADFSGFTVQGAGTYTYATLEGNLTYRHPLGTHGELRHQFGLSYKELPETIGPSVTQITDTENLKVISPHYGLEYWDPVTPKLGFQMNMHLYPSLLKVKTLNDQPIKPTLSYQLGLMGSYRLTPRLTGLAGYAYRVDRIDYQAMPGQGSAQDGSLNSVQLTGHYLNFYLEWSL